MMDYIDELEKRYNYLKNNILVIVGPHLKRKNGGINCEGNSIYQSIDINDSKQLIALADILFTRSQLEKTNGYQYIEQLKTNDDYLNEVKEVEETLQHECRKKTKAEKEFERKVRHAKSPRSDKIFNKGQYVYDLMMYLDAVLSSLAMTEMLERSINVLCSLYKNVALEDIDSKIDVPYILSEPVLRSSLLGVDQFSLWLFLQSSPIYEGMITLACQINEMPESNKVRQKTIKD